MSHPIKLSEVKNASTNSAPCQGSVYVTSSLTEFSLVWNWIRFNPLPQKH